LVLSRTKPRKLKLAPQKNGAKMQPFSKHTGLVLPLDRLNVDTDQMVPKQFLKLQTKQGYGRVLFYDWRYLPGEKPNPDFILNKPRYKGASVLLARAGFGCGSSREHAPWAIADYGFRVIVAPSYADIFYSNSFMSGLLPVILPEARIEELFRRAEAQEGYSLSIDLPAQTVSDASGLSCRFEIDEFRKHMLLEGLDEIGLTLKYENQIAEYENTHRPGVTRYSTVDAKYSAQK
jgi:3-isopropylmalate/(R)-2-methylmalate dehydratase small subunit